MDDLTKIIILCMITGFCIGITIGLQFGFDRGSNAKCELTKDINYINVTLINNSVSMVNYYGRFNNNSVHGQG
jgi:hypothetical protein